MKKAFFILFASLMPFISLASEKGIDQKIDEAFKPISDFISGIIFFEVFGGADVWNIPGLEFLEVPIFLIGSRIVDPCSH